MTIRTVSDIRSKLSELSRTKEQALRDDETEFQSAKRALGMFDCAQKDAIESSKRLFKSQLDTAYSSLASFVFDRLGPNEYVPRDMHDSSEQWASIQERVDAASLQVSNDLTLENSWNSDGSKAYRKHVERQQLAMLDLSALAGANATLTDKIAVLHEGIFSSIYDVLDRANRDIKTNPNYPSSVRTITRDQMIRGNLVVYPRTQVATSGINWARSVARPYTELQGRNITEANSLVAALEEVAESLKVISLQTREWPRPVGGLNIHMAV